MHGAPVFATAHTAGSIEAAYAKGCLDGSIHHNLALLLHGGHGENVCKGFWVVPHTSKVHLGTAIRIYFEDASTLSFVGKEMTVVENVDRRLAVE